MINIILNGQSLQTHSGQSIIQVADALKVHIPRFCYHPALSVAANCRMCLVEVEKMPKTVPACATPITDGMIIHTTSLKTRASQKAVMDMLLINHPLDCPICDQGGQCELQDLSLTYGHAASDYDAAKRAVPSLELGPLIATDMTRCIHCTRCVRFMHEVAGQPTLGTLGRGEDMRISNALANLQSELSGNIIDICPVGALTSKPFRFAARAWEMRQALSLSPHDPIGTHVSLHTKNGTVMRVVPRPSDTPHHFWLSDRDRFGYEGLNHQRLTVPMRKTSHWQEVAWSDVLPVLLEHLKQPLAIGLSGMLSSEEGKMLHDVTKHTACYQLMRTPAAIWQWIIQHPWPALHQLSTAHTLYVVGLSVLNVAPLLGIYFREALKQGVNLVVLQACSENWNMPLTQQYTAHPDEWYNIMATWPMHANSYVCIGEALWLHPQAEVLLAKLASHGQLMPVYHGANAMGLAPNLFSQKTHITHPAATWLIQAEPQDITLSLHGKIISWTSWKTPVLEAISDWMIPITPFSETSGTWRNAAGKDNAFEQAVPALGLSKPIDHILKKIASLATVNVCHVSHTPSPPAITSEKRSHALCAMLHLNGYQSDIMLRQAPALQQAYPSATAWRIHPDTMHTLKLSDGVVYAWQNNHHRTWHAQVVSDVSVAPNVVLAPLTHVTASLASYDHLYCMNAV
jgi:NADH-quinone oxidoreductase subunit G